MQEVNLPLKSWCFTKPEIPSRTGISGRSDLDCLFLFFARFIDGRAEKVNFSIWKKVLKQRGSLTFSRFHDFFALHFFYFCLPSKTSWLIYGEAIAEFRWNASFVTQLFEHIFSHTIKTYLSESRFKLAILPKQFLKHEILECLFQLKKARLFCFCFIKRWPVSAVANCALFH